MYLLIALVSVVVIVPVLVVLMRQIRQKKLAQRIRELPRIRKTLRIRKTPQLPSKTVTVPVMIGMKLILKSRAMVTPSTITLFK
jgi:hypothetical protein